MLSQSITANVIPSIVTQPNMYARSILFGKMKYELGDHSYVRCPENGLSADLEFKTKRLLLQRIQRNWRDNQQRQDERRSLRALRFVVRKNVYQGHENGTKEASVRCYTALSRALISSSIGSLTESRAGVVSLRPRRKMRAMNGTVNVLGPMSPTKYGPQLRTPRTKFSTQPPKQQT